jgi:hypothetical protein
VLLIVSSIIFNALPERRDLCHPSDMVRDERGLIQGCKALNTRI